MHLPKRGCGETSPMEYTCLGSEGSVSPTLRNRSPCNTDYILYLLIYIYIYIYIYSMTLVLGTFNIILLCALNLDILPSMAAPDR
jgi:hypothetical protein